MTEQYISKIRQETEILATKTNMELITTFFEANKLIPGLEVSSYRKVLLSEESDYVCNEKYYNAICIKYPEEDIHIGVLLLNLSAKHHGLENMLIDYLQRLQVSPIRLNMVFTKTPTNEDVTKNFQEKVVPKMKTVKLTKSRWFKTYANGQEK